MKHTQNSAHAHELAESLNPGPTELSTSSSHDGIDSIDRRGFLSCMAWAGTGLLWTMAGGIPTSKLFAAATKTGGKEVQIGRASCRERVCAIV